MGAPALVIAMGAQRCAIPLPHVGEVMRPMNLVRLEGRASFVLGAAQVRGEQVPVVDLQHLVLDRPSGLIARWLTVHAGGASVVLAVERVVGTAAVSLDGALPPLLTGTARESLARLSSVDGQLALVLEAGVLVHAAAEHA